MAYFNDPDKAKRDALKASGMPPEASSTGAGVSGAPNPVAGAPAAPSAPGGVNSVGAPTGAGPTGFINLQNWLGVNQNAVDSAANGAAGNYKNSVAGIGTEAVDKTKTFVNQANSFKPVAAGPNDLNAPTVHWDTNNLTQTQQEYKNYQDWQKGQQDAARYKGPADMNATFDDLKARLGSADTAASQAANYAHNSDRLAYLKETDPAATKWNAVALGAGHDQFAQGVHQATSALTPQLAQQQAQAKAAADAAHARGDSAASTYMGHGMDEEYQNYLKALGQSIAAKKTDPTTTNYKSLISF